jgi:hypothetical protein
MKQRAIAYCYLRQFEVNTLLGNSSCLFKNVFFKNGIKLTEWILLAVVGDH